MERTTTHPTDRQETATRPRRGLCVGAVVVAASAVAGAIGLASGKLDLGERLNERLPWHSPVLGGIALTVAVAAPYAVVAWCAGHGDERTDLAALISGLTLVGWILVELGFIREVSFLHPVCAGTGLAFAVAGRKARPQLVGWLRRAP